ncbi:MAG TPA: hypothetical protein VNV43_15285 [Candidatus Acidoferrales bacterium]|jgi:hypothetical protein|nr:hypothetical protein [Candidatus Acidoferrales bacterium]
MQKSAIELQKNSRLMVGQIPLPFSRLNVFNKIKSDFQFADRSRDGLRYGRSNQICAHLYTSVAQWQAE